MANSKCSKSNDKKNQMSKVFWTSLHLTNYENHSKTTKTADIGTPLHTPQTSTNKPQLHLFCLGTDFWTSGITTREEFQALALVHLKGRIHVLPAQAAADCAHRATGNAQQKRNPVQQVTRLSLKNNLIDRATLFFLHKTPKKTSITHQTILTLYETAPLWWSTHQKVQEVVAVVSQIPIKRKRPGQDIFIGWVLWGNASKKAQPELRTEWKKQENQWPKHLFHKKPSKPHQHVIKWHFDWD